MATQYQQRQVRPLYHRFVAALREWRYHEPETRDLRLDLLRGLCLVVMIIDHIAGPSWMHVLTTGNTFYVSAAEGFVFISGLLIGTTYRKTIAREGFEASIRKAFRRARSLYLLMVVLTLLLFPIAWLVGMPWKDLDALSSPLRFVWDLVALRRSYFLTDILVMYTLLIVGAPLVLWFLQRYQWRRLLAGSWVLWLAYQLVPSIAGQPFAGIDIFHPAAWQILFVHAMVIGFHRERIALWMTPRRVGAICACAVLLLFLLSTIYRTRGEVLEAFVGADPMPWLTEMSLKAELRPLRLLAALAVFPCAYLLVTYFWKPIATPLRWLLLPLGQRSLYAYTMHLPLVVLFAVLLPDSPGVTIHGSTANALAQLIAVLIVWLMVKHRFLFSIVPQ